MTSNFEYGQVDKANAEFNKLAQKYGLNPYTLREIVILRNKGMNNAQIAAHLNVSRNTVNKYVNALNQMATEDLMKLLGLIAIIGAGAYLFIKFLEALSGDSQ